MRVGIVGYGVVGGSLATVLEETGHEVAIYDPFKGHSDHTVLGVTCEVIFICVWTPMKDGRLDVSTVWDAVETVTDSAVTPLIAIRSTVTPGTMRLLQKAYPDQEFAFVPEFLVEADPINSTRNADRIVIGADHVFTTSLVEIMKTVAPAAPVVRVSAEEAVMVKLASNGLLASKVAIANELYDICKAYGVEWDNVRGAVGLDRRIGPDHLRVTEERGYGGSCFPKDVQGLIGAAKLRDVPVPIFDAIQTRNTEIRNSHAEEGALK